MYDEDALLPISALQHLRFCQRRAALVHVERLWSENRFTAQGNQLHEIAHDAARSESHSGLRIVRGMMLHSFTLGLWGKTDVVEFDDDHDRPSATIVEYKRGKPKPKYDQEYALQVCAQAMCLEEMQPHLNVATTIYYGQIRRRVTIELSPSLRSQVMSNANSLHELISAGHTPAARYERKCESCSMKNLCMPRALRPKATASQYLLRVAADEHGANLTPDLWQ